MQQTKMFWVGVSKSEKSMCSCTAEHFLSLQSITQVQSVIEILTQVMLHPGLWRMLVVQ